MHAIRGSWVGQPITLAMSQDPKGKKSRIRRSKEERKDMVESFIKKYQKSNSGNFPSLNHTHKEVGGSFYVVREIVREIIQENRVLAPPKVLMEEHDKSFFLEHQLLGSLSSEPEKESPVLLHDVTGSELIEEYPIFDPVIINTVPIHHQGNSVGTVTRLSSQTLTVSGNPKLDLEQHFDNVNNEIVYGGKAKEFEDLIFSDSEATLLPRQMDVVKVEVSEDGESLVSSNALVETFPLRPVLPVSHDINGRSVELCETTETFDNQSTEQEKVPSILSPATSTLVLENEEKDRQDLILDEHGNEYVVINNHSSSLESSSICTMLDVKVDSKASLLDEFKVTDSSDSLISKESLKLTDQDKTDMLKESGQMLDRLKLETQKEGSNKSDVEQENNPILALVKTVISAFVKFWTE